MLCLHPMGQSQIGCSETEPVSSTPITGVPHLWCQEGEEEMELLPLNQGQNHGAALLSAPQHPAGQLQC